MHSRTGDSHARGFLSYRRDDNASFRNVVERIKTDLSSIYVATTGTPLDLFLDKDDIAWGENWRDSLNDKVKAATVFIPVITMRYFESQICLEELLLFHETAQRLGVRDLILPIVLFGAKSIRMSHPIDAVKLIASLNYIDVEAAWVAGYDSSVWLSTMVRCARGVQEAVERSHIVLERAPGSDENRDQSLLLRAGEVSSLLDETTAAIALCSVTVASYLDALTRVTWDVSVPPQAPDSEKASLRELARPADRSGREGQDLLRKVVETDAALRAFLSNTASSTSAAIRHARLSILSEIAGDSAPHKTGSDREGLRVAIEFMNQISANDHFAKKTLLPAISGFRAIAASLDIFESWRTLQ